MPAPRRAEPEARSEQLMVQRVTPTPGRQTILEAAAAAIAQHGYFGMSMRDLAKKTGKGLSTFYSHFESKEDVLFALQEGAFATLTEAAARAVSSTDDPVTQLYLFISNHVHYVAEHPDIMRVLVHEASALPQKRRTKIRALKEAYFRQARELIARLLVGGCGQARAAAYGEVDAAELERATYNLFGMLNWLFGWYEPEAHGDAAEIAKSIHRLALCGLVASCPERGALDRAEKLSQAISRPSLLRVIQERS